MANNCYDTKLLQYSGTSQSQRVLQALLPGYAKVDERTTAQLILFAKKYGAYLNLTDFSNKKNDPDNSWQAIMSNDVSVIIAELADWKVKTFASFLSDLKDKIQTTATDEEAKQHFKTVFDFIFSLASALDASVKQLEDNIRFTSFLSVSISSGLSQPLALLYQYYKAFRDASLSLIDESSQYKDPEIPVAPVVLSGTFHIETLDKAWQAVPSHAINITLEGASVRDDINHVLTHNLFTGPLQLFINGIFSIVSKAPAYLEETLTNYPSHQPHYALYLAFLRLFRYAQDHLNLFTQNHLDFYYKDVLQLKNRNAEPGFVHLLFDLQKSADQYLLSKGTTFKAGKDDNNNDLLYAIMSDVVLQKSSVQSLQSLYLNKDAGILYASPVANSEDGEGEKLLSSDQSWSAFRNGGKTSPAAIGFAIASHLLYLNEGDRNVAFTFHCSSPVSLSEDELAKVFAISFTGKKDWFEASARATRNGNDFTLTVTLDGNASAIVPYSEKIHQKNLATSLPAARLMLANYRYYKAVKELRITSLTIEVGAAIKDLSLQNKEGVINSAKPFKPFGEFPDNGDSFIIGNEEIFQKPLTYLSIDIGWQPTDEQLIRKATARELTIAYYNLRIKEYTTAFTGGMASMAFGRNTSDGDEPAKKMMAAAPASSNEAAMQILTLKETAKLQVKQELSEIKANGRRPYSEERLNAVVASKLVAPASLNVLSGGAWNENSAEPKSADIRYNPIELSEEESGNLYVAAPRFSGNQPYDSKIKSGFIRLRLNTDNYSLATYVSSLQMAMSAAKVNVNVVGGVIKDYTIPAPQLALPAPHLVANSIHLRYAARTTIDFNRTSEQATGRTGSLYYIEPFGTRRAKADSGKDNITLLPQFDADNGKAGGNGGELWLGIKDASAGETLSLLFQISDGSSNPMKDMTVLSWFYLSGNQWMPLDEAAIADDTENLTRSGIVTITLPNGIAPGNTCADASLLWIKLVADHDTDAVNKLVSIRMNAAKAAFVQDNAKGIEYKKALAVNVISKPSVPVAAIKKTEQPYPSFGGRLHESNDRFYTRVSERLRHKHRAVTIWDYERLVLNYFPQVHKAKCIPHTGFITSPNSNATKYSEVLPGHVLLVTVPELKDRLSSDVLRPYTSKGLTEQIKKYLETLMSPFVTLHVGNPQFEEVQFDFEVMFLPNHDATFYRKQLDDDIEQFLTPWAYSDGRDIEFGGKIQKSVVLNFVEERSYVDFVTNFTMNHFITREDKVANVEEAVASTARSILVSYSDKGTATRHLIHTIENRSTNG